MTCFDIIVVPGSDSLVKNCPYCGSTQKWLTGESGEETKKAYKELRNRIAEDKDLQFLDSRLSELRHWQYRSKNGLLHELEKTPPFFMKHVKMEAGRPDT